MWPDNETTQDFIGFKVHADLIHSIVVDPNMLPVSIGIFGDWGSGKTSIMKMLQASLDPENYPEGSPEREQHEKIACLYFNGWLFEGYDDAKSAILSSVLLQLGEHKCFGPKVRGQVVSLLKSVNWMRLARMGFQEVALPAISAYITGGASLIPSLAQYGAKLLAPAPQENENSGEAQSDSENNPDQDEQTFNWEELIKSDKTSAGPLDVRSFRDQFSKILQQCDIDSLVVLIDDLDRCSPDRIIENLEAIKLFLNVESTAFVIGADPRMVRHAIATRYKPEEFQAHIGVMGVGEREDAGEKLVTDYLEKLIQIPYYLPRLSPAEVETYMVLLFCQQELDDQNIAQCLTAHATQCSENRYAVFGYGNVRDALEDAAIPESLSHSLTFCASCAPLITEGLKGNPRQVKRFLNAFILRKKLAEVANLSHVRDDVLVKLMVLEYGHLQHFRMLFEWQASQDGFPQQLKELEQAAGESDEGIPDEEAAKGIDSQWTSLFLRKWVAMEPRLADVDLRDYFWISRDRLQSTFSDVSMIPPVVRRVLEDLISGNSGRLNRAARDTGELQEDERSTLLALLEKHTKQHPDQQSGWEAMHTLIEQDVPGAADLLAKTLVACPVRSIWRTEGVNLMTLMQNNPSLEGALQPAVEHLEQTNSGIAAAIKSRKQSKSRKQI